MLWPLYSLNLWNFLCQETNATMSFVRAFSIQRLKPNIVFVTPSKFKLPNFGNAMRLHFFFLSSIYIFDTTWTHLVKFVDLTDNWWYLPCVLFFQTPRAINDRIIDRASYHELFRIWIGDYQRTRVSPDPTLGCCPKRFQIYRDQTYLDVFLPLGTNGWNHYRFALIFSFKTVPKSFGGIRFAARRNIS